jgi:hypothetical protein
MQGITENLLGGKLREEISKLLEFSDCCITDLSAAHEVELGLLKHLLHIGKLLLLTIIKAQISSLSGRKVVSKEGEIVHKKGNISRDYLSIFGKFRFIRPSFWSKERGKMYLVDSILELPKDQTSYVLQEILLESASESDYSESVRVLNRLLDLKISAKHSERNMSKLGCLADAFYDDIPIEKESEPVCFSASFDGKGVPKIKEKIEKKTSKKVATAKSDTDVSPSSTADNPKKRLGKGEKRNVMQMATVSVTSSFSPKARSKENIIKALIYSPLSKVKEGEKEDGKAEDNGILEARTNDNRWHQGIHRRAF